MNIVHVTFNFRGHQNDAQIIGHQEQHLNKLQKLNSFQILLKKL